MFLKKRKKKEKKKKFIGTISTYPIPNNKKHYCDLSKGLIDYIIKIQMNDYWNCHSKKLEEEKIFY